jgi:hypothetical protein
LIADSGALFFGKSSLSASPTSLGVLSIGKEVALQGIDTISLSLAESGTLSITQDQFLTGYDSISQSISHVGSINCGIETRASPAVSITISDLGVCIFGNIISGVSSLSVSIASHGNFSSVKFLLIPIKNMSVNNVSRSLSANSVSRALSVNLL